jgi:hypothetical protein
MPIAFVSGDLFANRFGARALAIDRRISSCHAANHAFIGTNDLARAGIGQGRDWLIRARNVQNCPWRRKVLQATASSAHHNGSRNALSAINFWLVGCAGTPIA